MPPLEPQDIIDRLKLCLTRRKLPADVDAAIRNAISEVERVRAEVERTGAKKAAKRGTRRLRAQQQ
jgi:hypothetical protein